MSTRYMKHDGVPITPFPIPLTTPPETRMYFVMVEEKARGDEGMGGDRCEQR